MLKKILAGVALTSMLIPAISMAAVNVSSLLVNDKNADSVSIGGSVNLDVFITNDNVNDIESIFVKFPNGGGSSQIGKCFDVSDQTSASPVAGWAFSLDSVGAPVTAGTYDVSIATHGTDGDPVDDTCSTAADDTEVFSGRVTTTGSSTSGGSSNSSSAPSWFTNWLQSMGFGSTPAPTPTPTVSPTCVAYNEANVGTQMGVYSDANVRLQGFLLSKNAIIPALKAGASFGYYGNQTAAAVSWFKTVNSCQ